MIIDRKLNTIRMSSLPPTLQLIESMQSNQILIVFGSFSKIYIENQRAKSSQDTFLKGGKSFSIKFQDLLELRLFIIGENIYNQTSGTK